MQHARRQMGGENEDIDDTADQLTSDEERAFSLMLLFTSMDCFVKESYFSLHGDSMFIKIELKLRP